MVGDTAFTKLVGIRVPIQQAGMPDVATVELAAAVASAGGLGMIGAGMLSASLLDAELDRLAAHTSGAFGVNFLVPFLDRGCVPIAARRARAVEFFYGDPDPELVALAHAGGALASWQVGSLAEAVAAERAGCDLVVAQGSEAGGHVRGHSSLLPLLSEVLDAVRVPVLAAGGIATPRDVAAVLACGAAGARVGTRFVAAAESGAHPEYVKALLAATAADTCLTEAFGAGWPDAPHRVLRSSVEAAQAAPEAIVGEIELGGAALPIARFSPIVPTARTRGRIGAMALYAGESVTHVRSVQPAAEIVADLVSRRTPS
jgi:nitronate monooxygenase